MNNTQRRLEFEKLVEHDDDFNCAAHSEGKDCCLDKGEKRHDKIKSFLSESIHQAEQEMLERVKDWAKSKKDLLTMKWHNDKAKSTVYDSIIFNWDDFPVSSLPYV